MAYGSTTLALKAVRRQYYPFRKNSKYIPAQTTFRQQKDNSLYINISPLCASSSPRVERKRLREEDQEEDQEENRDRRLESASRPPSRGQKGLRADEEKSPSSVVLFVFFSSRRRCKIHTRRRPKSKGQRSAPEPRPRSAPRTRDPKKNERSAPTAGEDQNAVSLEREGGNKKVRATSRPKKGATHNRFCLREDF